MPDTLPVRVTHGRNHVIEPETTSFETTGSFTVAIKNDDAPTHVHLRLDDELSRAATLEANNHYVDDPVQLIDVTVDRTRVPTRGKLTVSTGYGATTKYIDVSLVDSQSTPDIEVDEQLGVPQDRSDGRSFDVDLTVNTPLAALGGLALGLAVLATAVAEGMAVAIGVFAVLAGISVAGLLLVE